MGLDWTERLRGLGFKSPDDFKREDRELRASLPSPLRKYDIRAGRFNLVRRLADGFFVGFCDHLLENFPKQDYVFLARDANPLKLTMDVFIDAGVFLPTLILLPSLVIFWAMIFSGL